MGSCWHVVFVAMTRSLLKATKRTLLYHHQASLNRGNENQGGPSKIRLAIFWIGFPGESGRHCAFCSTLPCPLTTTKPSEICAWSRCNKKSLAVSEPNRESPCSVAFAVTSQYYESKALSCCLHSTILFLSSCYSRFFLTLLNSYYFCGYPGGTSYTRCMPSSGNLVTPISKKPMRQDQNPSPLTLIKMLRHPKLAKSIHERMKMIIIQRRPIWPILL